MIYPERSNHRR